MLIAFTSKLCCNYETCIHSTWRRSVQLGLLVTKWLAFAQAWKISRIDGFCSWPKSSKRKGQIKCKRLFSSRQFTVVTGEMCFGSIFQFTKFNPSSTSFGTFPNVILWRVLFDVDKIHVSQLIWGRLSEVNLRRCCLTKEGIMFEPGSFHAN